MDASRNAENSAGRLTERSKKISFMISLPSRPQVYCPGGAYSAIFGSCVTRMTVFPSLCSPTRISMIWKPVSGRDSRWVHRAGIFGSLTSPRAIATRCYFHRKAGWAGRAHLLIKPYGLRVPPLPCRWCPVFYISGSVDIPHFRMPTRAGLSKISGRRTRSHPCAYGFVRDWSCGQHFYRQ